MFFINIFEYSNMKNIQQHFFCNLAPIKILTLLFFFYLVQQFLQQKTIFCVFVRLSYFHIIKMLCVSIESDFCIENTFTIEKT